MKLFSKGDTLIEVIIAITLFGLIAVGAINVMVQGVYATQRALEITLVRQELDAQTASIRFLHNAYVASYKSGYNPYNSIPSSENTPSGQWFKMMEYVRTSNLLSASEFGSKNLTCPTTPKGSFIMNTRQAKAIITSPTLIQASLTAKTNYDNSNNLISSEGIWIEAIRSPDVAGGGFSTAGYVDFHIRACWTTSGSRVPATLGTIVRLYEPRN